MSENTFSIDAVFDELNKRVTSLEKNMPDYLADLLEIGRSVGTLHNRVMWLEDEVKKLITTVEKLLE